jgi:outer membrane protein TolC
LSPGGNVGLGVRAQQLSRAEAPGASGEDRRGNSASAGATLSWEIDLFGRLSHAARAADARTSATEADAAGRRLAVGAEIAQVWFTLNGAREQLRLTRTVVENRRETVQLVQRRVAAGYTAPLDEARSRADLAAAEADVPTHEAALALAAHRLAVLLGTSPSVFQAPAASSATPRPVALYIPEPAHWARLRPDLKSAEARLQAQSLDVESIRAEFLPRLSVAGVLGFVAGSVSGLGAVGSASWFIAPSVSVPIFDRGRIDARLQAAQAGQREALLAYHQQVLRATEEVESALAQVRQGQLRLAALQTARAMLPAPKAWRASASRPEARTCWNCWMPSATRSRQSLACCQR